MNDAATKLDTQLDTAFDNLLEEHHKLVAWGWVMPDGRERSWKEFAYETGNTRRY
jgi:hypothetical protein